MGFYSSRVSKTLKALLDEAAGSHAAERMDLAEEVDLARATAERALKIFDKVCLDPETSANDKITDELRIHAQSNLRDALKFVSDMVGSYGKMACLSKDILNAIQVDYLVIQLTVILQEELGEDSDELPRILERLQDLKAPDKSEVKNNVTIQIS